MNPTTYKIERKGAKGEHIYLLPTQKHTHTLIWLHGLGDTADDVFTSGLNPVSSSTKVVMLTAPIAKVTINFGMQMTSWFDFKDLAVTKENFEQAVGIDEIKENSRTIGYVLDEEIGILQGHSQNVFIGGFSQGAAMALHCGLQFPNKLAGILVFSGFAFPITKESEKNSTAPILISHGTSDSLLPFDRCQLSYKALDEKLHKIDWEIINGLEHGFCNKSWQVFKNFFDKNLHMQKNQVELK